MRRSNRWLLPVGVQGVEEETCRAVCQIINCVLEMIWYGMLVWYGNFLRFSKVVSEKRNWILPLAKEV